MNGRVTLARLRRTASPRQVQGAGTTVPVFLFIERARVNAALRRAWWDGFVDGICALALFGAFVAAAFTLLRL